eukprot:366194-Chlamydomonas_euryale.AAC.3
MHSHIHAKRPRQRRHQARLPAAGLAVQQVAAAVRDAVDGLCKHAQAAGMGWGRARLARQELAADCQNGPYDHAQAAGERASA